MTLMESCVAYRKFRLGSGQASNAKGALRAIWPGLLVAALAGCTGAGPGSAPQPPPANAGTTAALGAELVGTEWQLVRFVGGDDAVLTPASDAKYAVRFDSSGKLAARLDCNQGSGSWVSTRTGGLELGPLALTRAMCGPGSLQDRMARDWTNVRSYVLANGKLHLALQADAGIYEFVPARGVAMTTASVTGTASYLERMALSPDASFSATLEDVTVADKPAPYLGRTQIDAPGQPPIKFTIAFDPQKMTPNHRYAIRAQIASGKQILFTTDTVYEVNLAKPAPLDLLLRRVVANAPAPSVTLKGTYWKLASLGGRPVVVTNGQREPNIVLNASEKRMSGSGGCNQMTGSYTLSGDRLSFSQRAGTMMACIDGMETEQALNASLDKVAHWRIIAGKLELLDSARKVLATFEARVIQ
jgi:putative lipoprotein